MFPKSGFINSSKTFSEKGIPIFPASIGCNLSVFNMEYKIFTVVDLPFEPVTAIIGVLVNLLANSISPIIGIFNVFACLIISISFGTPGETTQKSASYTSFEWFPVSTSTPFLINLFLLVIISKSLSISLTNIFAPNSCPNIAAA